MTALRRYLEENLALILRGHALRVSGIPLPAGTTAEAYESCLMALRPRDRWPENTRVYAALRSSLAENPLAALTALGVAAATGLYLGLGRAAVSWLGALLGGPV
ncbi:MAG: hypothetical protein C4551_04780 [Bacillota bacterium]|nr:MAG: hypothetical protein C4551_04780 [Bacillota bacterium]